MTLESEKYSSTSGGQGSIVCVGVGMTLGSHITPLARSYIEHADVVFCSMSDSYVQEWVCSMNQDVRSLQNYYAEGKDRRQTYREMIDAMMAEVRAGKRVVGAFYGHPGVFALAPHAVIEQARAEGFEAHMEAGVGADACLYADMGLDPGTSGCVQYEASQFMLYEKHVDPTALLILWQVGLAGDFTLTEFVSANVYREVLVRCLSAFYPLSHKIALYEAAVLPIEETRIDWIPLAELPLATVHQHTTMVIPPLRKKQRDQKAKKLLNDMTPANEKI